MTEKIHVQLNGSPLSVSSGTRLLDIIVQQGWQGKRIAIEVNEEIVPKSQHSQYEIQSGDVIEVVHAIGGG